MISLKDREFKSLTPCEYCLLPVYPSRSQMIGKNQIIKAGAIIIRIDKKTGKELRRSVICYDCQNDMLSRTKTGNINTKDVEVFMSYVD
jgi:hypothetical protein